LAQELIDLSAELLLCLLRCCCGASHRKKLQFFNKAVWEDWEEETLANYAPRFLSLKSFK
jgi:hypothetical protein